MMPHLKCCSLRSPKVARFELDTHLAIVEIMQVDLVLLTQYFANKKLGPVDDPSSLH